MVIALNTRTILSIFRDMKMVKYNNVGWGDDEAVQLAEVLPLCHSATELQLESNELPFERSRPGRSSFLFSTHGRGQRCRRLWLGI